MVMRKSHTCLQARAPMERGLHSPSRGACRHKTCGLFTLTVGLLVHAYVRLHRAYLPVCNQQLSGSRPVLYFSKNLPDLYSNLESLSTRGIFLLLPVSFLSKSPSTLNENIRDTLFVVYNTVLLCEKRAFDMI